MMAEISAMPRRRTSSNITGVGKGDIRRSTELGTTRRSTERSVSDAVLLRAGGSSTPLPASPGGSATATQATPAAPLDAASNRRGSQNGTRTARGLGGSTISAALVGILTHFSLTREIAPPPPEMGSGRPRVIADRFQAKTLLQTLHPKP